jgi:hypothetical protein
MPTRALWPALALLFGAPLAYAADLLGPESCKSCHPEAYAIWKASRHARAKQALTPEQQKDAKCLTCHSPSEARDGVVGVSCETCHGAGEYYAASYVMKDPELARLVGLEDVSEKTCRSCHDDSAPSLKPFVFVDKLKLIDHWSQERTRRAEGSAAPAPAKAP